ncbi:MAG: type III pantothenate kinase [Candidatus Cloacimonetes bacterium]|nr:type III pantothenate kinase [Candidatus Cloacimonadota bacterium]
MHTDRRDELMLVVDIGNTNIVCGIYSGKTLAWHARLQSSSKRTADEYYALLASLWNHHYAVECIRTVTMASVVPELTRIWQHLFQKYLNARVVEINGYSPLGLSFRTADPGFIGADLIVNAFSAVHKYKTSCIICDLGTATTIQLVTASGEFYGTIIAPGLRTGASFLFERAALLSEIELTSPNVLLGTNTRDALLSGIIHGHANMIERFIEKIRSENSDLAPITAIATGGIADLIKPLTASVDVVDKTLTLDGLFAAGILLSD